MTRIDLEGGKYSVIHDNGIGLLALRYGEPWRNCCGDGLILALVQEIESLRDELAAVKPATHSPWRPIETAPQDGTPVDIFADGMRLPDMRRVQLKPDNVFYSPVSSGPSCVRSATHWMPLPAAPVKPAGQKGGE